MDWKAVSDELRSERRTTERLITDLLRDAIGKGVFQFGERLNQDELARRIGVSKIPIREALRNLSSEGLVELIPHKGAVVRELSAPEIRELHEITLALETLALRRAIDLSRSDQFISLRKLLVQLESISDLSEWLALNHEFHCSLYRLARRPQLLSLIEVHRRNINRYIRVFVLEMGSVNRANEEHRRLLEHAEKGDADGACKVLAQHLERSCEETLGYLQAARRSHADGHQALPLPPPGG